MVEDLIIKFINVYIPMLVPNLVIYYILCNSADLKINKKKAYLMSFIYAQYVPVTDTLSLILIGQGLIPYTGFVYLLLKVNLAVETLVYLIFIVRYVKTKWYKIYWWPLIMALIAPIPIMFYFYYFTLQDRIRGITIYPVNLYTMPLYILFLVISIIWGIPFLMIGKNMHKFERLGIISKRTWYQFYAGYAVLVLFSEKDYFMENNLLSAISNYKKITLFIIAALAVLFIAINQAEKRVLKAENTLLMKQKELQFDNYLTYLQQEEELLQLYYEIGDYIKSIKLLISRGERQEAKNYTGTILERYKTIKKDYYCNNKIINAVLTSKMKICVNKGISFYIDVQLPENIQIKDIDLMSVFSNLVDNAIEGCLRNPYSDNYISVKAAMIGNYVSVRVDNSKAKDQTVTANRKGYITWKENKKLHGYGLKIIKEVVERYEGQKEFNDLGDTFSSLVMLKIDSDEVEDINAFNRA